MMEIVDDNTIVFKSFPENYFDELNNNKPNTVRIIPEWELEKNNLVYDENLRRLFVLGVDSIEDIIIINIENEMCFARSLTDVRPVMLGGSKVWVFSWQPETRKEDDMIYMTDV